MSNKKVVIGSRGSDLALWQAHFVADRLKEIGLETTIEIIKTKGDRIQDIGFDKMEGKGFFTKEIEAALLAKKIDVAVHSFKDLETTQAEGLCIAAISARANPSDVLLIRPEARDEKELIQVKHGAVVGTSSARRREQITTWRPDVAIKDLRGNVPTRIDKLREGNYDAILLAAAGIERLAIDTGGLYVQKLLPEHFIPAPAQGFLGIQVRSEDKALLGTLNKISNPSSEVIAGVEREALRIMEGGCRLPFGAYAELPDDADDENIERVRLRMFWKPDNEAGVRYICLEGRPDRLAERAVERLRAIKSGSVFITRDLGKNDFFQTVLEEAGNKVYGKALNKIKRIGIGEVPETKWVFFSSKNAVRHFFAQKPKLGAVQYAAIGRSTAAAIRQYGYSASFIGSGNDTRAIAKMFTARVGRDRVLFPQAKESIRRMQQYLHHDQLVDLPVYETILQPEYKAPACDVLVFTSPSNVAAFLQNNIINDRQKLVAMGHATAKALREKGFTNCFLPPSFDQAGLVMAVQSAIATP